MHKLLIFGFHLSGEVTLKSGFPMHLHGRQYTGTYTAGEHRWWSTWAPGTVHMYTWISVMAHLDFREGSHPWVSSVMAHLDFREGSHPWVFSDGSPGFQGGLTSMGKKRQKTMFLPTNMLTTMPKVFRKCSYHRVWLILVRCTQLKQKMVKISDRFWRLGF